MPQRIGLSAFFFLKVIGNNTLVLIFWVHVMAQGGFTLTWMFENFGLSFNILVGNVLYLAYYGAYEYHRKQQAVVFSH